MVKTCHATCHRFYVVWSSHGNLHIMGIQWSLFKWIDVHLKFTHQPPSCSHPPNPWLRRLRRQEGKPGSAGRCGARVGGGGSATWSICSGQRWQGLKKCYDLKNMLSLHQKNGHPYVSTSKGISKSIAISKSMFISLSLYFSLCFSICLSACLPPCLSVCLSVFLSIYISIHPSIHPSILM